MSKLEKAPPIAQRPKCRACREPLRPNFLTEKAPIFDRPGKRIKWPTRRVYELLTSHIEQHYDGLGHKRPVTEDDEGAFLDEKSGRWYVEKRVWPIVSRKFLGTYGRYGDNLFCGLNCAYHWALRKARGSA